MEGNKRKNEEEKQMGKMYLFFLSLTSFVFRKSPPVLVSSINSLSKTTQRNTYGRNKTSALVQELDKTDVSSLNTRRRFIYFFYQIYLFIPDLAANAPRRVPLRSESKRLMPFYRMDVRFSLFLVVRSRSKK